MDGGVYTEPVRTLLVLALLLGGLYLYAENFGLAVGGPPFIPVYYWKYSGTATKQLRVSGIADSVKVMVSGRLSEGSVTIEVRQGGQLISAPKTYTGNFKDQLQYRVSPGLYDIVFRLERAKGSVRYDWVSTKFDSY